MKTHLAILLLLLVPAALPLSAQEAAHAIRYRGTVGLKGECIINYSDPGELHYLGRYPVVHTVHGIEIKASSVCMMPPKGPLRTVSSANSPLSPPSA